MSDDELEDFLLEHVSVSDVIDFILARDDVRRMGRQTLAERVALEDAPIPTLRSA